MMPKLFKRKGSKLVSKGFREAWKILSWAQKVSENNTQENISGLPTGLLPTTDCDPTYQ